VALATRCDTSFAALRSGGYSEITDCLAQPWAERQDAVMHLAGTMLARSPRMNERPMFSVLPAAAHLSPVSAAEAPAPAGEEPFCDEERAEELDKYDISTLACTD
jgi:hypothetical protein